MRRFAPLAAAALLTSVALTPAAAADGTVASWLDDKQASLTADLTDKLAAAQTDTQTAGSDSTAIRITPPVITVQTVPVKRLAAASAI